MSLVKVLLESGLSRVWSNLYSIARESPCPVLSVEVTQVRLLTQLRQSRDARRLAKARPTEDQATRSKG